MDIDNVLAVKKYDVISMHHYQETFWRRTEDGAFRFWSRLLAWHVQNRLQPYLAVRLPISYATRRLATEVAEL